MRGELPENQLGKAFLVVNIQRLCPRIVLNAGDCSHGQEASKMAKPAMAKKPRPRPRHGQEASNGQETSQQDMAKKPAMAKTPAMATKKPTMATKKPAPHWLIWKDPLLHTRVHQLDLCAQDPIGTMRALCGKPLGHQLECERGGSRLATST